MAQHGYLGDGFGAHGEIDPDRDDDRDRGRKERDRDYEDYCREREQQFHRDFDSWRNQRHGNPEPLRTGMTQTGLSHDPTGEMQLTEDAALDPQNTTDPMGTATLGTTSGGGRRK